MSLRARYLAAAIAATLALPASAAEAQEIDQPAMTEFTTHTGVPRAPEQEAVVFELADLHSRSIPRSGTSTAMRSSRSARPSRSRALVVDLDRNYRVASVDVDGTPVPAGTWKQSRRPHDGAARQAARRRRTRGAAHPLRRQAARGQARAVGRRLRVGQGADRRAVGRERDPGQRLRPVLAVHRSSAGRAAAGRPARHRARAAGGRRQRHRDGHGRKGRLAHLPLAHEEPRHLRDRAQHRPVRTAAGRLQVALRQHHPAALLAPARQRGEGATACSPSSRRCSTSSRR